MTNNDLKNIVVLKNLPSNIIDEAIVILKSNKNVRKLQLAERKMIFDCEDNSNLDNYVIKEAEMVISNYIEKIENNKSTKKSNNNIETKYKKIKVYSICVSIILVICLLRAIL